nr:MAG TPA: hypothetical protein [Caudoviricetes sp.]
MDLEKENGKYIFGSKPKYSNFPKAKESYLEAPLTKCGNEIIDKIEIFPYYENINITKVSFKIFYFDVISEEKFRVEIQYIVENEGWFIKKKDIKKYWEIKVYKINSQKNSEDILTDEQLYGTSLSNEIEEIFQENQINEAKIIEFLLKFNYTKYSKDRNLKIGGNTNA